MNNRTLVYMTFLPDCIIFRTVSRKRKSPQCFYILRSCLAELEYKPKIIAQDINSFAVIRRGTYANVINLIKNCVYNQQNILKNSVFLKKFCFFL